MGSQGSSPEGFKLLYIDIETTPALVYVWGLHKVEIGVDQIVEPTSVLCFAAKWHGSNETIFHKAHPKDKKAFRQMIEAAHELLGEADAVCHYNGASFDIPRLNQEFLREKMKPPRPPQQIDLFRVVTKQFGLLSNKLAFVGPYFNVGKKIEHEGWKLWRGCLDGNKDCWRRMEAYCRQDV